MTDAVRAYALEVATKAAKNIGGSVAEVLRRTKSQAYLFGRLRRQFPDVSEGELSRALVKLRHSVSEDDPNLDFITEARKPTVGREAGAELVWQGRADRLVDLVDLPLEPAALLLRAHTQLGWGRNFTIQTLAAAESAELLEYADGMWRRLEPDQQPNPCVTMNVTQAEPPPEETMTTPTAPESPPAFTNPTPISDESAEERKRRKKREANKRSAERKRAGSAPAAPAPSDASLDAAVEAVVRRVLREELGKALAERLAKVLAA